MLKIAWSEEYVLPLPPSHRFPMSKYAILPEQLLHEGTISEKNLFRPEKISRHRILAAHTEEYWEKLHTLRLSPQEERRTGFPLSHTLVHREQIITQGTIDCVEYALTHGIAMNIAGGTHHAFTYKGEGFCLLNDQAIGSHYLLAENKADKILIVDLDVHQGNGTAEIFRNESRVFTFSMHGANNYPLTKEKSDLDIPLPDHTRDREYLTMLDRALNHLVDLVEPDFMFFQSGVDILETDKLGRLSITREGCKMRDKMVLNIARKNNIPVVVSMGGGYSPQFKDIIEAHANTFRLAQDIFF